MREFIERIHGTIERYRMFEWGDSVLVGLSGGPDSVALLHSLYFLRDRFGLSLTVGHLNHGLRGEESERDESFVRDMAEDLGVALVVEHGGEDLLAEPGNLEERSRLQRYAFLQSLARKVGAGKIAVGHTANDQAETFFLWLLQGAGRKGLGGIPPVRDGIIRPLIDTQRTDIEKYLRDNGIPWVDDSSNRKTVFLRNRIRRRLIPVLEEEFEPHVVKLLSSTTEVLRDEETLLERITQQYFQTVAERVDDDTIRFEVRTLASLPKALQRRLVREALRRVQGSLRKVGFDHIEAVLSLLHSESPHAEVALPDGLGARREYDMLHIDGKRKEGVSFRYSFDTLPHKVDISEIGRTITFDVVPWTPDTVLPRSSDTVMIDYETVEFPLVIRSIDQGDRFRPLGAGGAKKVKDFFIDLKVPVKKRKEIPLVVFNEVIGWVGGYRIDDRTKVTEHTKTVLRMVVT